jgi:hypothetical protein
MLKQFDSDSFGSRYILPQNKRQGTEYIDEEVQGTNSTKTHTSKMNDALKRYTETAAKNIG